MFDRWISPAPRPLDLRQAALTLLSLLIHGLIAGGILLTSWLEIPPLTLPRARIIYLPPPSPPRAGAPAPRLGSRSPEATAARPVRDSSPPRPLLPEVVLPPPEAPAVDPQGPPETGVSGESAAGQELGPGDPQGVPNGDPNGKRGSTCVGDGCDPEGLVGAGPGARGGMDDSSSIFRPGIDGVTEPVIIESSRILPRYPEIARRSRVTGLVLLQAVIRIDGTVASMEVVEETPPRLGFKEAAIEAVSRWRYRPGMLQGRPVAVSFTVRIEFTLSR